MTTRDEEAEKALKLFQLAVEDHNDNPYIVKVAHVEAAYQAVLALICPPAPAAITEDVTIRLPREQADAIRKTLRAELLSWGFGRTGSPMWTKMDTFVAALDEALDAAAPAQSGGEASE